MLIRDWSSDVCASDLLHARGFEDHDRLGRAGMKRQVAHHETHILGIFGNDALHRRIEGAAGLARGVEEFDDGDGRILGADNWRVRTNEAVDGPCHDLFRSEEHTSELQSLMRISYAVF